MSGLLKRLETKSVTLTCELLQTSSRRSAVATDFLLFFMLVILPLCLMFNLPHAEPVGEKNQTLEIREEENQFVTEFV